MSEEQIRSTPESAVKTYRIHSEPVTLDLYAENPPQWFRIPSWRVEFFDGVLKGVDVRVHRGLGSGAPWTLTEATTGALMLREGPRHEYAPDSEMEDVIDEFVALYVPKLTTEKVAEAITAATARLATKIPCPFGTRSERTSITEAQLIELRRAIGALAMAIGNPCVQAKGDQTIESQTVREAVRRIKEGTA